jgi:hypothetical protein
MILNRLVILKQNDSKGLINKATFSTGAYEDSKRKLSKMMAQLERKLVKEEKKNVVMNNIIDQSKAEKEQYKQKYFNLKQKLRTDECNQLRMNKIQSMDPNLLNQPISEAQPNSKLTDYRDMRMERKMGKKKLGDYPKQNSQTNDLMNFLNPDPAHEQKDKKPQPANKLRTASSGDQINKNVFDRLLQHSTITSRIKQKPQLPKDADGQGYGSGSKDYFVEGQEDLPEEFRNITESQLMWN